MSKLFSLVDKLRGHKILFSILICFLFVGFIDSNSIWERHFRWQRIDELEAEIASLEKDFQDNTQKLEELRNNPRKTVQIARERYYMTRPGEDLFLIKSEGEVNDKSRVIQQEDGSEPEV